MLMNKSVFICVLRYPEILLIITIMANSYKELDIYKTSFDLFLRFHKFSLGLPKYELYELGSQLRRSSDSINSNITEGYGRRRYKKDFIKFLTYSHSSNDETVNHLKKLKTYIHKLTPRCPH